MAQVSAPPTEFLKEKKFPFLFDFGEVALTVKSKTVSIKSKTRLQTMTAK